MPTNRGFFMTRDSPPINPAIQNNTLGPPQPFVSLPQSTELHIVTAIKQAVSIISGYLTAKRD
jgi:hypothetical protein